MKDSPKQLFLSSPAPLEPDPEKLSSVKRIIEGARNNGKLLESIVAECLGYLYGPKKVDKKTSKSGHGGYKSEIEKWMEARFQGSPALAPSRVAYDCRRTYGIPAKMTPYLIALAQKLKNRVRMRLKRGSPIPEKEGPEPVGKPVSSEAKPTDKIHFVEYERFPLATFRIEPSKIDETIAGISRLYGHIVEYWHRFVAPHKDLMMLWNVYDVAYSLFHGLLWHGSYLPSLLDNPKYDRESGDYATVGAAFKQVTLVKHTFHVIEESLKLAKQQSTFYDHATAVRLVIVSMAHDVSKIYGSRGRFAKIDHAKSSASLLRALMPKGAGWDSMYDDILLHHESQSDSLGTILKQADGLAREKEMAGLRGTRSYPEMETWFDVGRYTEIISQDVNAFRDGRIGAFTLGSVLYATPDFLHACAVKLADERGIFDVKLFRRSDRRYVLVHIARILKERGLIAGDLPKGYYGRAYDITFFRKDMPNRTAYMLPLTVEKFGMPHDLEKKKKGYIRIIERVSFTPNYKSDHEV